MGLGEWRILVGDDAVALDATVRKGPGAAYEPGFEPGPLSVTASR